MEKKESINIKLIVKILLFIALICFIMPFVTVSCSYGGSVTISGTELASGIYVDEDVQDVIEEMHEDDDILPINLFVTISLLSTLTALIFAFIKKEKRIIILLSATSAIALLLFMITFKYYYKFNEEFQPAVHFRTPVYIIMILNIITAVLGKESYTSLDDNAVIKSLSKHIKKINIEKKEKPVDTTVPIPISSPVIEEVNTKEISHIEKEISTSTSRLKSTMRTASTEVKIDETGKFTPAGDL